MVVRCYASAVLLFRAFFTRRFITEAYRTCDSTGNRKKGVSLLVWHVHHSGSNIRRSLYRRRWLYITQFFYPSFCQTCLCWQLCAGRVCVTDYFVSERLFTDNDNPYWKSTPLFRATLVASLSSVGQRYAKCCNAVVLSDIGLFPRLVVLLPFRLFSGFRPKRRRKRKCR